MPRGKSGTGPWGPALVYWLAKRGWSQAELVRAIHAHEAPTVPPAPAETRRKRRRRPRKMQANTVSRVCRGLDTNTAQLRRIAAALGVALADVLVSPEHRNREQDDRARVEQAVRIAMRLIAEERQQEPLSAYEVVRAEIAAKDIRVAAQAHEPLVKEPVPTRPRKKP